MGLVKIKPCGVAVEGLFYPEQADDQRYQDWRTAAEAHAATLWESLGRRPVILARKGWNQTLHALRTEKRGYGLKARHWQVTTECGQIMRQGEGWQHQEGRLGEATCLSCRTVVRERFERDLDDGLPDEVWADYEQQDIEEMWRIQAEWHQPGWSGDRAYWSWCDRVLFPAGAVGDDGAPDAAGLSGVGCNWVGEHEFIRCS